MRKITVTPKMPGEPLESWLNRLVLELVSFSEEGIETIFDDYTVTNYTVSRTLNAGTATATQVADFLCTLVADVKKRGTFTETGI